MNLTRNEAVELINRQLKGQTPACAQKDRHHYGLLELKELVDSIYGPLKSGDEEIKT